MILTTFLLPLWPTSLVAAISVGLLLAATPANAVAVIRPPQRRSTILLLAALAGRSTASAGDRNQSIHLRSAHFHDYGLSARKAMAELRRHAFGGMR